MPVDTAKGEFTIPATVAQIVPASERMLEILGCPQDYSLIVAIQEALANAIVHGSRLDPENKVRCSAEIVGDEVVITIRDSGPGFDFGQISDPTIPEGIHKYNGRGLTIIRSVMDNVSFRDGGATIEMRRRKQK